MEMKIDGCRALITGASAGIGREFARQLAARGCSLVLVARRRERLAQLRDELCNQHPNLAVYVHVVDLSEKSQVDEFVQWLKQNDIKVDFLINNAGLGDMGPFATSDPLHNHQMLSVNIVALTVLTRALLPQMISRNRGAILNVSSTAGFLPIPNFAVYAATKAYVTSFSEALRGELGGTGVTVTTLCPGPVHTEFGDVAKRPGVQPRVGPEFIYVSTEQVVKESLDGVEAGKPLVIPGWFMKLGMFLARVTPMPVLRLAWRIGAKRA